MVAIFSEILDQFKSKVNRYLDNLIDLDATMENKCETISID